MNVSDSFQAWETEWKKAWIITESHLTTAQNFCEYRLKVWKKILQRIKLK